MALGHRGQPFNANTVVRQTEKELEDSLLNQVEKELFFKVFLVFEDKPCQGLRDRLFRLAEENEVPFRLIDND